MCMYIKWSLHTSLPAAHYFTEMADRQASLLQEAKNSTTTGCFLLTRLHIVVFTIFVAELTTTMVDTYIH